MKKEENAPHVAREADSQDPGVPATGEVTFTAVAPEPAGEGVKPELNVFRSVSNKVLRRRRVSFGELQVTVFEPTTCALGEHPGHP